MYVKKAPIKEIKYYLAVLALVSIFQVVMAINISQNGNMSSWQNESIEANALAGVGELVSYEEMK